jgi:hypothetical protein
LADDELTAIKSVKQAPPPKLTRAAVELHHEAMVAATAAAAGKIFLVTKQNSFGHITFSSVLPNSSCQKHSLPIRANEIIVLTELTLEGAHLQVFGQSTLYCGRRGAAKPL